VLSNPRSDRIKSLRRLHQRKVRAERRLFIVEGGQAVAEALMATARGDAAVREVFLAADDCEQLAHLESLASQAGVSFEYASAEVVRALTDTVSPQGAVAICEYLDLPLETVLERQPTLITLAAQVRDPGNAGSLIRVADAVGADAVVLSEGSVDPYNGKVVRASVGSLFHLPIVDGASTQSTIAALGDAGLQVLAADGSGEADLDSSEVTAVLGRPTAWVFGNEAWGLPDEVKQAVGLVVRIPIYGRAESLNLATAAALCLYASARAQH
jgi:RNA methyltransferase, TrmH family